MIFIVAIVLACGIACWAVPRYLKMLDARYYRQPVVLVTIVMPAREMLNDATDIPTVAELEAMFNVTHPDK